MDWMNDPALSGIDPTKMALLNSLIQQGDGKSQNDMLPFLLMVSQTSKQKGIHFTQEEITAIVKVLKQGKSPKEQMLMDRMLQMMPKK